MTLHISELSFYPVKSAGAISIQESEITLTGFPLDRRWMVVTESGRFMSQRDKGAQKMALIHPTIEESDLALEAPDMPTLRVPLNSAADSRLSVQLFDNTLEGVDQGDEAAAWFSRYLPPRKGETYRLVSFPGDYTRSTTGHYTQAPTATTQFADGYAFLITSAESLDLLNTHLTERGVAPVNMKVFRPNIVVRGEAPWAEDSLLEFEIGDTLLEVVKPCARCPITGVTQERGAFSARPQEPRETLKAIHAGSHLLTQFPNLKDDMRDQPMFGQNAIVKRAGKIQVGDEIQVIRRRS